MLRGGIALDRYIFEGGLASIGMLLHIYRGISVFKGQISGENKGQVGRSWNACEKLCSMTEVVPIRRQDIDFILCFTI
jgi:hypothetical protein